MGNNVHKPPSTRDLPASNLSDFYVACRNGAVDMVQNHLKTIRIEDMNRLEPNGSTALHAASYNGHTTIVQEILKTDKAIRSTRNRFGFTASDE
ncbi:unnamed protein product, partial [Didymodactylos carnosus]